MVWNLEVVQYDWVQKQEDDLQSLIDRILSGRVFLARDAFLVFRNLRSMLQHEDVMVPVSTAHTAETPWVLDCHAVRMLLRSLIWSKISWNPRRILTMLTFCRCGVFLFDWAWDSEEVDYLDMATQGSQMQTIITWTTCTTQIHDILVKSRKLM